MVMHIRIPPPQKPRLVPHPPLWPPDDPLYDPMWDGRVSTAIRIWALLHRGPYSTREINREYRIKVKTIYYAVAGLRSHGCRIKLRARQYHLLNPEGALPVMNLSRGVSLAPHNPRFAEHIFHITCSPHGDDWGLAIHGDPPATHTRSRRPPAADPPGEIPRQVWRPGGEGDCGLVVASTPIMVWGHLKSRSWSRPDLARELDTFPVRISNAIIDLRDRGHRILVDRRGRYCIPGYDAPLLVEDFGFSWRLARRDGRYAGVLRYLE